MKVSSRGRRASAARIEGTGLTPQDYEDLILRLVSSLCESAHPGAKIEYGRSNRVLGASGYRHQIDVSVEHDGKLILVEAKHWREPVGVDGVLVHQGRVRDIQRARQDIQVLGVIASMKRLTRGGSVLAKDAGVEVRISANVTAHFGHRDRRRRRASEKSFRQRDR